MRQGDDGQRREVGLNCESAARDRGELPIANAVLASEFFVHACERCLA